MKMNRITVLCLLLASTWVWAAQKPEDMIKYRQSGYMFMRWNMGIIKQHVVKNPQQFNKEKVMAASRVIDAVARSGLEQLFQPETKTGKGWKETRVKPEYFDQPDEVRKRFETLRRETGMLVDAAGRGEPAEIKTQFEKVFKACKGCHKKFRSKK